MFGRDFLLREIIREMALVDSAENDYPSANNDDVSTNSQNSASSIIDVIDCDITITFLGIWCILLGKKVNGQSRHFLKLSCYGKYQSRRNEYD